jgi:DNA-binding NtrC family response regulator
MAQGFLTEFGRLAGRPELSIAPEVMRALEAYSWPGNIRELRNVIERAVALSVDSTIAMTDLPEVFSDPRLICSVRLSPSTAASSLAQSKNHAERERIEEALERNGNNRLRAATELGISRMTLYNKLRKLGLVGS